jgi:hypothetical protein
MFMKEFVGVFKTLRWLVPIAAVAAAGCGPVEPQNDSIVITDDGFERAKSRFYEEDNRYAAVINESEEFFNNRDIEGAILSLDDDFTMYEVTEAGVEERVRGIERVREALGGTFDAGTWLGANVYKWGLTDNTLVQIEEDFFSTEDGGRRSIKTLVVFEHRDGKRWREWRFKPKDM